MSDATERFLDLATRPLAGNAELHLAAQAELREQLEAHAAASPQALATAADSLARADRHPRRKHWRTALYLTTMLVFLPLLGHFLWQYYSLTRSPKLLSPTSVLFSPRPDPLRRHMEKLNPQQRLLLFGNRNASNDSDCWKPLWDSAPENPAFLVVYAAAYFRDHKELSPEILEAAAKIDPDNGWYPVRVAAATAEGSVTKKPALTTKEREAGKAPEWQIVDAARLQEALAQLHQATAKPMLATRQAELLRQRIRLLPPRDDTVSQVLLISYLAGLSTTSTNLHPLADIMSARARECARNKDAEGFRRIVADWQWLSRHAAEDGLTLIGLLIARSVFESPLATFRDSARELGLGEEARRFAALEERTRSEKKARQQRREPPPGDLVVERGSLLACLALFTGQSMVAAPPPLAESDLRPGRYADHAVLGRTGAVASCLLLGLCAGFAALHRFRHGPLVRALSARLLALLRPSDWAWILAGGIAVPVLWHLAITRLTSLGARQWSLESSGLVAAWGQLASQLVLTAILPAVIARWRLAKRGAPLGLTTRRQWPGCLAAAAVAAAIPVFGAMRPAAAPANPDRPILACVLTGAALLWLLVGFSRSLFGWRHHALRRAVLARILLPAWFFGMLVFALSIPLHYAEERHWIQQDRLFEISADAPALSRYEWQVTQELRKELLETMASW